MVWLYYRKVILIFNLVLTLETHLFINNSPKKLLYLKESCTIKDKDDQNNSKIQVSLKIAAVPMQPYTVC